jgi:outer membrane protein
LNNPVIYNRYSNGVSVGQLVTDFGRTENLVSGARLRAEASAQGVQGARALILLRVTNAYLSVLRARALLRVAQATVAERQLLADQAGQLAKNKLKSGLDVSFAKVNLEQARLLLVQAENGVEASRAALAESLGSPIESQSDLVEVPIPAAPPADVSEFIAQALRDRPELAGQRFTAQAAQKVFTAERDLWFPTVSAVASAGYTPISQHALADHYAAAGLNINVPIFNGHLFGARRAEAESRARAESANLRDLENQVVRDVRLAWLDDRTAFERLSLTRQLLDEAQQAADLAGARYRLGLASIVEVSQAELALTQAQMDQAAARYDFQIADTVLQFQLGALP